MIFKSNLCLNLGLTLWIASGKSYLLLTQQFTAASAHNFKFPTLDSR